MGLKERSKGILFSQLLTKRHPGIPSPHEHSEHKYNVQFSPPIPNKKFLFYNIDSPYSRNANEQQELNRSPNSNNPIIRTPTSFSLHNSGKSIDSGSPNFSDLHGSDQKHSSPIQMTHLPDMKANSGVNQNAQQSASLIDDTKQHSINTYSIKKKNVSLPNLNVCDNSIENNLETSLNGNKQLLSGEKTSKNTNKTTLHNEDHPTNFKDSNNSIRSTLPTFYLMENSSENCRKNKCSVADSSEDVLIKTNRALANDLEPEELLLDLHESSSEQDLFWKLQLLNNSGDDHESLQDEISQVNTKYF